MSSFSVESIVCDVYNTISSSVVSLLQLLLLLSFAVMLSYSI